MDLTFVFSILTTLIKIHFLVFVHETNMHLIWKIWLEVDIIFIVYKSLARYKVLMK